MDWQRFELTAIQKALAPHREHFGLQQLKSLYSVIPDTLRTDQIQSSLNHFAYGLTHFPQKGCYQRRVKVATLMETLKEGRVFVEPRYLTPEQQALVPIYRNLVQQCEREKSQHFQQWLSVDRDEKYRYYRTQTGSTEYYDERVFVEKAKKDFFEPYWVQKKQAALEAVMGKEVVAGLQSALESPEQLKVLVSASLTEEQATRQRRLVVLKAEAKEAYHHHCRALELMKSQGKPDEAIACDPSEKTLGRKPSCLGGVSEGVDPMKVLNCLASALLSA
jgi:hypothetical protein